MPHPKRILAALAAVLLLGGLLNAGTSGAAPATDTERATPAGRYGHAAFRATNQKRQQYDRRELRRNTCVQRYAVKNARRMANRQVMEHQQLEPIAHDCGLNAVAENIAAGYPTGRAAVRAWMHSTEGHRENILSRTYRLLGVAARKGDNGQWYAAQVFGRKG